MSAMDAKFYLMLLTGVLLQLFSVQAGECKCVIESLCEGCYTCN